MARIQSRGWILSENGANEEFNENEFKGQANEENEENAELFNENEFKI